MLLTCYKLRSQMMINLNKFFLIMTITLAPVSVWAQIPVCEMTPTCTDLGYKQKSSDCAGQRMLKCPLDQTQVFCLGEACSADYSLSSCDSSIGTCEECGGKYKYTACNEGYNLRNGKCTMRTCPLARPYSVVVIRCKDYYPEGGYEGIEPCYCCNTCSDDYPIMSGGRCYTVEEARLMGGEDAPCGM